MHYILNGKEAVKVDMMIWAKWLEETPIEERTVAKDEISDVHISTVFIGLDHNFNGPPHIFETMVFEPENGGDETYRYSTWKEAEKGHKELVDKYSKPIKSNFRPSIDLGKYI